MISRASRISWFLNKVGERSKIQEQVKAINGTIIQMSMSYWPKLLAQALLLKVGYRHELCDMADSTVEAYLRSKAAGMKIESFVESTSALIAEEQDEG